MAPVAVAVDADGFEGFCGDHPSVYWKPSVTRSTYDGDEEGADREEVGVGRAAAWLGAADSISPFFLSVEPLLRRFPFLPE